MRAPVGGLFRHVHDLALGEAQFGAEVGVVCDLRTGGDEIAVQLGRLGDNCALGLTRFPMSRQPGFGDSRTVAKITKLASELGVDVLHGHGVEGGAYARLAGRKLKRKGMRVKVVYTPHGGSLHYSPSTLSGRLYLAAERRLARFTDGFIFESVFAANRYVELVGHPECPVRIVPNGLYRHEFYEGMLADDAVDFVYVGELWDLEGRHPARGARGNSNHVSRTRDYRRRRTRRAQIEAARAEAQPWRARVLRRSAPGAHRVCPRALRGRAIAGRVASPISCLRRRRRICL